MSVRNHVVFWLLAFAGFIGIIFIFKSVLLPFVLGIAVAYLLNPFVNKLGRLKIPRSLSALLILSAFLLLVVAFVAVVAPLLYKQLVQLVQDMPGYIDSIWVFVEPYSQKVLALLGQENGVDVKAFLGAHVGSAAGVAGEIMQHIAAGGQAFASAISVFVRMPIVAYFMMKEWNHITDWVEDLLPCDNKITIQSTYRILNHKAEFHRGTKVQ